MSGGREMTEALRERCFRTPGVYLCPTTTIMKLEAPAKFNLPGGETLAGCGLGSEALQFVYVTQKLNHTLVGRTMGEPSFSPVHPAVLN